MAHPTILAFDTSGPWLGTALLRGDDVSAAHYVEMKKGQAEHLMPLLEQTLSDAGVSLQDVDAIGVGIGPGNFTGIRISVSAARGLALALGVPAVGVSTLEALAFGAPGPTLTSVDGHAHKVYSQFFQTGAPSSPHHSTIDDMPFPPSRAEADVIGHRADELAKITGGRALDPAFPLTVAIARLAAARMHNTHLKRPAPLYIKPADAAPSRETGPAML